MCGIVALISPDPADHAKVAAITDLLKHRGPDNQGLYSDGLASLGHRRLSIIDLSTAGNQPLADESGRLQLVANGEIYNYKALTAALAGHRFRSGSDCETLLHLYQDKGAEMLDGVNGMFAFALWDPDQRRLLAAVDRFGKKPLYFVQKGQRLALASELKSLLALEWLPREIDPLALDRYLSLRQVPAPLTMFKGYGKLEPASLLIWQDGKISLRRYWQAQPREQDPERDWFRDFAEVLDDAVALRLQSEVPLGLYLSGGVDSAAVGGIMARRLTGPKVSYTAVFDYAYNEGTRAQRVADHLGFEYHQVAVGQDDFSLMPKIAYHLDEPFGDLLCLPAYVLAQKAKEQLTVVLTGDGADEILGGYFHQKLMLRWRGAASCLGLPGVAPALAWAARHTPCGLLNRFFDYPDRMGPRERAKLSQALSGAGGFGAFYEGVTSCFTAQDKAQALTPELAARIAAPPLASEFDQQMAQHAGFGFLSRLGLLDLKYWIPFSVLYRLDKMNMAHAVETRSPFLDYRLVELCLNLPDQAKLNQGRNKEALRRLIDGMYPPHLREKGKQAFYMPMTDQYRARFLDWAGQLLTPQAVAARGILRPAYVAELLTLARQGGSMLANRQLTSLAMLELCLRTFLDQPPTAAKAI
ncbi:MAG: asparagine synthase (glutamine-hydrolyzing) [Pseudomonadota bacterium]